MITYKAGHSSIILILMKQSPEIYYNQCMDSNFLHSPAEVFQFKNETLRLNSVDKVQEL